MSLGIAKTWKAVYRFSLNFLNWSNGIFFFQLFLLSIFLLLLLLPFTPFPLSSTFFLSCCITLIFVAISFWWMVSSKTCFIFLSFDSFFLTIAHAQRCLCFLSVCACYLYRRDPAIVSDKWSVTILKEVNQPSELFVSKQGVLGNRLVSSCQITANVRNRMSVSLRITNM